ncbi:VRR-NUC domain-containing protein, partial [Glycomyces sp. L485]|uniref:VRR-NUC domain-containing protein n=1 Tax=Glycomyces sp. L485 TaxID=2909235 RepID=UPI001F4A249C
RLLLKPQEPLKNPGRCGQCRSVMTCECMSAFANSLTPYTEDWYLDSDDATRKQVDRLLEPGVCHACRGLDRPVLPRRPYRYESKLRRYYWRELWIESQLRFVAWLREYAGAVPDWIDPATYARLRYEEHGEKYKRIESEVLDELNRLHQTTPYYRFDTASASERLDHSGVQTWKIEVRYHAQVEGRVQVSALGGDCTAAANVEDFTADLLRTDGWQVAQTESRPFHALWGTMMYLWVADPADPAQQIVMFGRGPDQGNSRDEPVQSWQPADVGSADHFRRRLAAFENHLRLLQGDTADLLWSFDYWADLATPLRQYLWANTSADIIKARQLIEILGAEAVRAVLRFLAEDYWGRYLGWPDLLAWRRNPSGQGNEYRLIEVKSSKDRLSDDQLDWIAANEAHLGFPIQIAKLHRIESCRTCQQA